jgi:bifunctional ADP-heptose synthase (sugar kinase/adenylyltransferase)
MEDKIRSFIKKVENLKIAVIGESIMDEFIHVSYEGQSMKSICPVYKLSDQSMMQEGGALAIANHLKDFVGQVDLFSNPPGEIIKTRYIDIHDRKKHVEINKFNISNKKISSIKTEDYDLVIVADFGHGYTDGLIIDDGFYLMCQTNSNNFGFNRISKWRSFRKRGVCIDLREASLQMNKKVDFNNDPEVLELYNYEVNTDHLFITMGGKGSLFYDGANMFRRIAFESEIVDTIGAGDTFFAFSCLTNHVESRENVLLIPSLAASLSTTWLCNERSVTKKSLLDYANKFI